MTQYALIIDLDRCVGCQACATNCKAWHCGSKYGPLPDKDPFGVKPDGVWFNRVQTYEVGTFPNTEVVYLPKSCMQCKDAPCVQVCPTSASYKRAEDGIVLVNYEDCIGCKYCSWACPYGCREFDPVAGVMKKCVLCIDRIYDDNLPEEERQPACVLTCPTRARVFGDIDDPNSEASQLIRNRMGYRLMPEAASEPSNHYLPKRRIQVQLDKDDIRERKQVKVEMERKIITYKEKIAEDIAMP